MPDKANQVSYYIGQLYQSKMKFEKAIKEYNEFLTTVDADEFDLIEEVKKSIDECKEGKEHTKH